MTMAEAGELSSSGCPGRPFGVPGRTDVGRRARRSRKNTRRRWRRASQAARSRSDADATGLALTTAERGRTGLVVSAAKVMSSRTATETTSHIFELTGVRATARTPGLDRFWRDARTLTMHDPLVYKAQELGTFRPAGKIPQITKYS
ncbi:hypothetical protein G3I55_35270 [Streptomyces sp. SID6648]|nr:hypothetical protein [Streptomyces sp. SID6648]